MMTRRNLSSAVFSCAAVILVFLLLFFGLRTVWGQVESFPEPDPPKVERDEEISQRRPTKTRAVIPATEWAYHKTPDNLHPDGNEQQMMWLMNRARANPTAEGIWLAAIYDRYIPYAPACSLMAEDQQFCYIASALDYWKVDLDLLQNEFAGYDAKPPAAFDVRLYRAAEAHSDYLISIDGQNHTEQFDRIIEENFSFIQARGNVFSYALSAIYGHAAFNVDWGPDGGDGSGMQSNRGHRLAIMALDGSYSNVGIAAVAESDPSTQVGKLVITGNYCKADPSAADHYNRFLVGTVWTDKDGDEFFDPDEGVGGVTVAPDQGTYYAITSNSGGYALPLETPGTYEVTFSGSALDENVVKTLMVGDDSVLLDLVFEVASGQPGDENSAPLSDNSSDDGGGGGGGCFIAAIPNPYPATNMLFTVLGLFSVVLFVLAVVGRNYRTNLQ
ncbi:MAG: hypothetical protein JSW26_28335 [Desulfobacterales bacterium]|nr:MAG: hypothetical protein JSW26_28335 [Desulfobacterales bacterium]